jgi:hypothetical protein
MQMLPAPPDNWTRVVYRLTVATVVLLILASWSVDRVPFARLDRRLIESLGIAGSGAGILLVWICRLGKEKLAPVARLIGFVAGFLSLFVHFISMTTL